MPVTGSTLERYRLSRRCRSRRSMPDSSSRLRRSARRRRASSSGEQLLATSTSLPARRANSRAAAPSTPASASVTASTCSPLTSPSASASPKLRHLLDRLLTGHVALGLAPRRPTRLRDVGLGHRRERHDQPGDLHVGRLTPRPHLRHRVAAAFTSVSGERLSSARTASNAATRSSARITPPDASTPPSASREVIEL